MPDSPSIESLLNRPKTERHREYKYRFAQSAVFGLPVLALHLFGPILGGAESARWIGLLQALLCGWVVYIGAVPMLVEGLILLAHRKIKLDPIVATIALALYGIGLAGWIFALRARPAPFPSAFSLAVLIVMIWSAIQWRRHSRS